ncbi:MAG: hypothetical protein HY216_02005 [Candidatus Rokubacteria bacterium]|nr:hypothetical protein [Candidatus Rokubacteria bacterium]
MESTDPWASGRGTVRLQFWCREADREVEVEFERLLPHGTITSVRGCTVFGAGAVTCARGCLEAEARPRWKPVVPQAPLDEGGG